MSVCVGVAEVVAPEFTVKQNKLRRNLLAVPVGNSVKLDCSADGNPRPAVKWYKDRKLFKERKGDRKLYLSQWTTVLVLKDLIPSDTGTYMCNVSNSYGWINHTYLVDVHERARAEPVLLPMENVTVYRGENASLTCKALSDSKPHFQWLRWFPMHSNASTNSSTNGSIGRPHYEIVDKDETDQHVISSSPSGKKFEFHGVKLTLVNVTKKDEGKYTCIVGNAFGYAVEHAYIIIEQSATHSCNLHGSKCSFTTEEYYNGSTLSPETEHISYLTGYELEFEYDALVIFSSRDSDWVNKTLIPTLEKKHGFKCCVHYRDFVLGVPYRENMVNSVYKSRKTIAVVSKNFFISNYCGSEMEYALHRLMERRDDSVVVIKLDDVERAKLPKELQKRSYIDYPNNAEKNHWERKLVNCLTIPNYPLPIST
ncbi:Fibroblast growth factor receptor 2 [Stylophora pistillata]|uniref:receptor protein-tyrosine kinase n=1 Tax=Stylophora pistillata TaxID=50429 RepID=A0A2B4SPP4_STYPI|nr:Fibroblast growth factor receptor 2 [Stylophora pistillata]